MKNRIKKNDENPDENPDDILKKIHDMLDSVIHHKLFDDYHDDKIADKYMEEVQKTLDELTRKVCKSCGNPYYTVTTEYGIKTTMHPSGLACHWCNYVIYSGYFGRMAWNYCRIKKNPAIDLNYN